MIPNKYFFETLEAMADDALAVGVPKQSVADWLQRTGQYAIENEMYEQMPEMHRLLEKYKPTPEDDPIMPWE